MLPGMAVLRASGGADYPLGTEALIGRSRRCEVRLEGGGVSSQHALMRWTGAAWELRDLGSRNATWVDDVRLEPGVRVVITEPQVLRIGNAVLTVIDDGPRTCSSGSSGGAGRSPRRAG
jgi:pSer/pThr/pTyr-binding forkhead associated (FHA) protein